MWRETVVEEFEARLRAFSRADAGVCNMIPKTRRDSPNLFPGKNYPADLCPLSSTTLSRFRKLKRNKIDSDAPYFTRIVFPTSRVFTRPPPLETGGPTRAPNLT